MKKFFLLLVAALPMVFTSCGDDNDDVVPVINLNDQAVTLNYGDTYKDLKCLNAEGKELKNVTWTIDNEFIATIDSKTGEITAKHVGEATVKAIYENATKTAKVTVKATNNSYNVPYLGWNSTMDQVKAEMNKWTNVAPTVGFDETDKLSYSTVSTDGNPFPLYGYVFLNNELNASTITEDVNVNDDNLVEFLKQRYELDGSDDDVVLYNAYNKNDATLKVTFDYLMVGDELMPLVTWLPYNFTKSSADDAVMNEVKSLVNAQIKAIK